MSTPLILIDYDKVLKSSSILFKKIYANIASNKKFTSFLNPVTSFCFYITIKVEQKYKWLVIKQQALFASPIL